MIPQSGGWPLRRLVTAALAALALLAFWNHVADRSDRAAARDRVETPATDTASRGWGTSVGFANARRLDEHYEKHGTEFGRITKQDYLHQAQILRDTAVGGPVLQTVRADGVTTRYDRQTGAFIAFNRDGIIRTFFKPNDGERYFRRQVERVGE